MSTRLTKFDRFMPHGGITIYPDIRYVDANDVDPTVRKLCRDLFDIDPAYKAMRAKLNILPYSPLYCRQFCTYVYKRGDLIGTLIYKEILNNPYGYREGDFLVAKRVLPDYRHTKYSRYMAADMIHMMFKSGIANNLYTYVMVKEGAPSMGTFWEIGDFENAPCVGTVFRSDGPTVQKYMLIKHANANHAILEFNGAIYKSMDLMEYFMAAVGRTEELAKRWLTEMDLAAELVRSAYASFTLHH